MCEGSELQCSTDYSCEGMKCKCVVDTSCGPGDKGTLQGIKTINRYHRLIIFC